MTTELETIDNNRWIVTVDLLNTLKNSSEIMKGLLPQQLEVVASRLSPRQVKEITELKPGESMALKVLRPRTWSELTNWALVNSPIEDTLLIEGPQPSVTENNQ